MFQSTPGVRKIFYINVSVFLLMLVIKFFGVDLTGIFACWNWDSPNFRWYQLITSQFVHGGIFHILGNMMALLSLGPLVEDYVGTKKLYLYYLLCGTVGGILQSHMDLPPSVGASGAVWGMVMMFGVLNPEAELAILFLPFGVKSKYLVGVLFAVEIICCIFTVRDGIGHWAHAGGALTGMLVVFYEKFNRKRRW